MKNLISFLQNDEGATAIEYGLIAALVSVVIIGVLTTLGGNLKDVFDAIGLKLSATPAP